MITWDVNYESDALDIVKRLMNQFVCLGDKISIRYDDADNNTIYVEYEMADTNEYEPAEVKADIYDYCGFESGE